VNQSIETLLDRNPSCNSQVIGIGVGSAGVINTKENKIVFANNLGLKDAPIGQLIEKQFNLPVRLGNDGNIAAIGEWIWGAGKGFQNVIYITVSTGIGAGIISNGNLVTGIGDSAGEFGHISVDLNGAPCICGNYGCLENYASGTAIARTTRERIANGEPGRFFGGKQQDIHTITAKDVAQAAYEGEPIAIEVFKEAGTFLGVGVTNLIHLFNPEIIVFGGSVMNAERLLFPSIEKTVKDRSIPMLENQVRLTRAILGAESGVMGAAGLFLMDREAELISLFNS
jgi:glucokinase